ncbi:MAG TPA: metal-dependent hydrolase [Naasia sp.]|jgi:alanyl-tRNA synthetase
MPLPSADTVVTYPDGDTAATATVLHVEPLADGRSAVLLDRTAFHPVDTAWPDQPADRGVLLGDWGRAEVIDAVTGGVSDGGLRLGADLPVRTGTAGWTFVVAHVVEGAAPPVGSTVSVEVDAAWRSALSAGHTACHLAALALDAALAGAWTKPAPTDALGSPAFDALAIQTSRISPNGSTDEYRIGKSLRKKGFAPEVLADPAELAAHVNAQLAAWLATGAAVRVERDGQALSGRRTWVCELPEGRTDIPCGGTHLRSLGELAEVTVSLAVRDIDGGVGLTMETSARPS